MFFTMDVTKNKIENDQITNNYVIYKKTSRGKYELYKQISVSPW